MSYQTRDQFLNYEEIEIQGCNFRGPLPDFAKPYIACLGGAQTFGCYCPIPFPAILANELHIQTLNLGYGGAGPSFFLDKLKYINQSKLAVVQVLSGRSEGNSVFQVDGTNLGIYKNQQITPLQFWSEYQGNTATLVQETRDNYVQHMIELLDKIEVRKVLFWFSTRNPEYKDNYNSVDGFWNKFPQMVNKSMIDKLIPHTDHYIELVSSSGLPQELPCEVDNAFLSQYYPNHPKANSTTKFNNYYPSPEMHKEAALKLLPICRGTIVPIL